MIKARHDVSVISSVYIVELWNKGFYICRIAILVCQVNELHELKAWTDNPKNNPDGVKFRNISERRKFVKNMGLKLVKRPTTGLDCVPVLDKTLMLTGHRKDTTREKREQHDDRASAKNSFNKLREGLKVRTNKQVRGLVFFKPQMPIAHSP